MGLWLETFGTVAVALCGALLGHWASRRAAACGWAMAAALGMVLLVLLARQSALWDAMPVLRPISASRLRFVLLAFAVTLGLSAPLGQLGGRAARYATCVILSLFLAVLVTLPFMGPALVQGELAALTTTLDADGVCRQSQPFTCGPAAAVTALKRFGLDAGEGPLAVAGRTSPVLGTSPWDLCRAIRDGYADRGLRCDFRHLRSLEQIPAGSVVLTTLRDALWSDHCVAILAVNDRTVTIADPMEGLVDIPRHRFARQWRNCGIILQRPL